MKFTHFLIILTALTSTLPTPPTAAKVLVGRGMGDVTGPATEIDFMGYAEPTQTGSGLRTRLFSRAFYFHDTATSSGAVYVSVDICMIMLGVKLAVVEAVQAAVPGADLSHENILLSGIHTHSGPGAYSTQSLLYDITTLGFDAAHFDAVVAGITASIVAAVNDATHPVAGGLGVAPLLGANINRSPSSYLANPPDERALYHHDVDKNMTVLALKDGVSGEDLGLISFFAVHCTSFHNTNRLVSSDNKGRASLLLEEAHNPKGTLPGKGPYVAAFGQANEGDVSPNVLGAWCQAHVGGTPCGDGESVCDGKAETCLGVGPGGFDDDAYSADTIGRAQAAKAEELAANPDVAFAPDLGVASAHAWVDMTNVTVAPRFSGAPSPVSTCKSAVGFSFAAGTTDGPGAFNFVQGDNTTSGNPLWDEIRKLIKDPTPEQVACHHPKPILLDTGEIKPHPWTPTVLPLQIVQVGQLVIIAVPGEFTTMSGRRLRFIVRQAFVDAKHPAVDQLHFVIAGLSNAYSQYIATGPSLTETGGYDPRGEYAFQRYEAASTLFGPHTLAAYMQEYYALATALATNTPVPNPGTPPPSDVYVDYDFLPPVLADAHPIGKPFGTVETEPKGEYSASSNATVSAVFWGANLRNNYMDGSSYLTVELQTGPSSWTVVATDASWETRLMWKHTRLLESIITVEWDLSSSVVPGTYRITHSGFHLDALDRKTHPYHGVTTTFQVTA